MADNAPTPTPGGPGPGYQAPREGAPNQTPMATEEEKGLAAVAYILTWITGLIMLLVAKKEQRYQRWNAIQAIGLGVAAFALWIVLGIISVAMAASGPAGFVAGGVFGLLISLLWIGVLVLIILLAVRAYQGRPIRLPIVAEIADKNA